MLLHQGIWRECIFARAPSNLAWWCEVENPSTSISFFWSVLHDCAKISHGHAKLLFTFPLVCCNQNPFFSFRMTMWKFHMVMLNHFSHFPYMLQPSLFCFISHGHAKLKNMFFRLLFAISLISSFLIHPHHLQLSSKAWSKCISLLLSLSIWIIINFICSL